MKISQKDRIINYIREFGSISSWEAYSDLGITQLGARIDQLKKEGYEFKTEWESNTNRFGEKTDYKRYYLADMVSENMNHITQIKEVVMKSNELFERIHNEEIEENTKIEVKTEGGKHIAYITYKDKKLNWNPGEFDTRYLCDIETEFKIAKRP